MKNIYGVYKEGILIAVYSSRQTAIMFFKSLGNLRKYARYTIGLVR